MTLTKIAEQLRARDECTMKVGSIARIQKCNARPEIVGEQAEIVRCGPELCQASMPVEFTGSTMKN